MPTTVHVKEVGFSYDRGLPPAGSSLEYVFKVWIDDGASPPVMLSWTPFEQEYLLYDEGIPRPGTTVADWDATLAGTWAESWRWRSIRWRQLSESRDMYECRATATTRGVVCPEPNVLRSDQTRLRRTEMYRQLDPANDAAAGTSLAASSYVDKNGFPRQFDVPQIVITVQALWDTSNPDYGYPDLTVWSPHTNKRNSSAFLGFATGSVLFEGIEVVPEEHEYVRLTWTFIWDGWFHMEQQPELEYDQKPILNATDNAETVKWFQPFGSTYAIHQFFEPYELEYLTNGWLAFATNDLECPALVKSGTMAASTKPPLEGNLLLFPEEV